MSDTPAVDQAVEQPTRELSPLARRCLQVAGYVTALPRGPRAILRRLRLHEGEPPPDAFWRLVDKCEIQAHEELFFLSILPLMIECPHAWIRPGEAVARAGVAKARVERWLRLDEERARREANRLLARLKTGLDWSDFGPLLFHWSDEGRRRAFARSFFLSSAHRKAG